MFLPWRVMSCCSVQLRFWSDSDPFCISQSRCHDGCLIISPPPPSSGVSQQACSAPRDRQWGAAYKMSKMFWVSTFCSRSAAWRGSDKGEPCGGVWPPEFLETVTPTLGKRNTHKKSHLNALRSTSIYFNLCWKHAATQHHSQQCVLKSGP